MASRKTLPSRDREPAPIAPGGRVEPSGGHSRSGGTALSISAVPNRVLGIVRMAVGTAGVSTRGRPIAVCGCKIEADRLIAAGKQTRHRRREPLDHHIPSPETAQQNPRPPRGQYASTRPEERGSARASVAGRSHRPAPFDCARMALIDAPPGDQPMPPQLSAATLARTAKRPRGISDICTFRDRRGTMER